MTIPGPAPEAGSSDAGPPVFDVLVRSVTSAADGVVSLTLAAAAAPALPPWEPGAHLDVHLPGGLVRQYSLCGDPREPTWRIAVLREPAGRGGSARVHDEVRAGDRLTVRGPRNHFPLLPAPGYLFVAGGIGVTPLLPMFAAAGARGVPRRLLYGGRTRPGMAFLADLVADPDVLVWPQDESGLLPLRAELAGLDAACAVYACGPEPMLAAVEKLCADLGREAPHVERFGAAPAADAGPERGFTVVLASSGDRYDVPPGRSILEVLEDGGVPVDSSCREGVCGTCEQRLLAGAVEHRDVLLSDAERAANDVLMICVSRATGAELVLDL